MIRCRVAAAALWVCTVLLVAGCQSTNPDFDSAKPHHTPTGFQNRYQDMSEVGSGFWRWQWDRLTSRLAPQIASRVKAVPVDLAYLRANRGDTSVTWIGHSTALWQLGGLNLLTDPIFSERASPLSFVGPKRVVPLPVTLDELPHIDVVLISHNHYDHLDRASVLALNRQAGGPPLFVVPLGLDRWLRDEGITNVKALDWWDRHAVGRVALTLVPAQHWSSRTPFDRFASLWGGFVAQADGYSMYYVGDTGYSRDFADIEARFGGFDFAQIPVGCYAPRWFMQDQHVNEDEAVQIHLDVRSRFSLGVHWGTFRLCDEPVDAPLDRLPEALARRRVPVEEFTLLRLGETRVLRRAEPPS